MERQSSVLIVREFDAALADELHPVTVKEQHPIWRMPDDDAVVRYATMQADEDDSPARQGPCYRGLKVGDGGQRRQGRPKVKFGPAFQRRAGQQHFDKFALPPHRHAPMCGVTTALLGGQEIHAVCKQALAALTRQRGCIGKDQSRPVDRRVKAAERVEPALLVRLDPRGGGMTLPRHAALNTPMPS